MPVTSMNNKFVSILSKVLSQYLVRLTGIFYGFIELFSVPCRGDVIWSRHLSPQSCKIRGKIPAKKKI